MKFLQIINPFHWINKYILKKRAKKNAYQEALQKIGYIIVRRMDNDRTFRRVLNRQGIGNMIDKIMHDTIHKTEK